MWMGDLGVGCFGRIFQLLLCEGERGLKNIYVYLPLGYAPVEISLCGRYRCLLIERGATHIFSAVDTVTARIVKTSAFFTQLYLGSRLDSRTLGASAKSSSAPPIEKKVGVIQHSPCIVNSTTLYSLDLILFMPNRIFLGEEGERQKLYVLQPQYAWLIIIVITNRRIQF